MKSVATSTIIEISIIFEVFLPFLSFVCRSGPDAFESAFCRPRPNRISISPKIRPVKSGRKENLRMIFLLPPIPPPESAAEPAVRRVAAPPGEQAAGPVLCGESSSGPGRVLLVFPGIFNCPVGIREFCHAEQSRVFPQWLYPTNLLSES